MCEQFTLLFTDPSVTRAERSYVQSVITAKFNNFQPICKVSSVYVDDYYKLPSLEKTFNYGLLFRKTDSPINTRAHAKTNLNVSVCEIDYVLICTCVFKSRLCTATIHCETGLLLLITAIYNIQFYLSCNLVEEWLCIYAKYLLNIFSIGKRCGGSIGFSKLTFRLLLIFVNCMLVTWMSAFSTLHLATILTNIYSMFDFIIFKISFYLQFEQFSK